LPRPGRAASQEDPTTRAVSTLREIGTPLPPIHHAETGACDRL
jgi:hypothetical protein